MKRILTKMPQPQCDHCKLNLPPCNDFLREMAELVNSYATTGGGGSDSRRVLHRFKSMPHVTASFQPQPQSSTPQHEQQIPPPPLPYHSIGLLDRQAIIIKKQWDIERQGVDILTTTAATATTPTTVIIPNKDHHVTFKLNASALGPLTGDHNFFQTYAQAVDGKAISIVNSLVEIENILGIPLAGRWRSGGRMHKIPQRGSDLDLSKVADPVLREFIAERDAAASVHMLRGVVNEDKAMQRYCEETGHSAIKLPQYMILSNSNVFGGRVIGTPDFITKCGRVIEIKCPAKPKYKLSQLSKTYITQLQSYMHMMERPLGSLVQYDVASDAVLVFDFEQDPEWLATRGPRVDRAIEDITLQVELMTRTLGGQ